MEAGGESCHDPLGTGGAGDSRALTLHHHHVVGFAYNCNLPAERADRHIYVSILKYSFATCIAIDNFFFEEQVLVGQ